MRGKLARTLQAQALEIVEHIDSIPGLARARDVSENDYKSSSPSSTASVQKPTDFRMSEPCALELGEDLEDVKPMDLMDEDPVETDTTDVLTVEDITDDDFPDEDANAEVTKEETMQEKSLEEEAEGSQPSGSRRHRRRRRRRRRHCLRNFGRYFPRVLKNVQKGMSLTKKAVKILNSFVEDIFQRIAEEASHLAFTSNRTTITCREIQTAVRLLLPGELGKHAVLEGTKALIRYTTNS
ncbi:histone H2B, sperm-like [Erinaceus europaeus]|uniref:Histone H2B, sperm-like n=1 Tax=Erinaceus europaeus TaxID=9365 RepID=A0A1S3A7B7_ERIEU|nr:histone H2B, sperm-like [Erinaceus europaeus]